MTDTQARAVRFDRYGDLDVLYLTDIPMPEVVVAVRAAGINPGEALIRSGAMHDRFRQRSRPARAATSPVSSLRSVPMSTGSRWVTK